MAEIPSVNTSTASVSSSHGDVRLATKAPTPVPMNDDSDALDAMDAKDGKRGSSSTTPSNGGATAPEAGLKPAEDKKAAAPDAKDTPESLAQKAFGMLKDLFANPVVTAALALLPAFWPSLGVTIGAIAGICALGTFIADWVAKDKNDKGPDWSLLGGGLLMAGGALGGISQLVSIGGLSLFLRSMMSPATSSAAKPAEPAPAPASPAEKPAV